MAASIHGRWPVKDLLQQATDMVNMDERQLQALGDLIKVGRPDSSIRGVNGREERGESREEGGGSRAGRPWLPLFQQLLSVTALLSSEH